MDCVFDALIAAATADIARQRFAYLIVVRSWIFDEECGGLHDLAGLAKAALRDIKLTPGFLDRVIASRMKALDGRNLPADHVRNRGDAGANGLLVDDNSA